MAKKECQKEMMMGAESPEKKGVDLSELLKMFGGNVGSSNEETGWVHNLLIGLSGVNISDTYVLMGLARSIMLSNSIRTGRYLTEFQLTAQSDIKVSNDMLQSISSELKVPSLSKLFVRITPHWKETVIANKDTCIRWVYFEYSNKTTVTAVSMMPEEFLKEMVGKFVALATQR